MCMSVQTEFLARWRNEDWRFIQVFLNMKLKCEDCILKGEDPKISSGWLDPPSCEKSMGIVRSLYGFLF